MSERQERIERALEIAARGAPYEACEVLWPIVREETGRDEALFAMASCFERAGNLPTAVYLYNWVAERNPSFEGATDRLAHCRRMLDERGIFEDFKDAGHVDCPCGEFRYRAELGLCPYCGRRPGEPEEQLAPDVSEVTVVPVEDTGEEQAQEAGEPGEARARSPLEDVWMTMQEKFEAFTQREDLGDAGKRVQTLAREMSERARQVAESERAKEIRQKLEDVGEEAVTRAKAAAEREEVQQARRRLEQWSNDAANRIESWLKSDEVRETSRKVMDTLEGFVAKLQGYIDRAKGTSGKDSDT